MALERCPACKKRISVEARSCPNCGHPLPAGWGKQIAANRRALSRNVVIALLIVFVGFPTLMSIVVDDETPREPAAKVSLPTSKPTPEEERADAERKAAERAERNRRVAERQEQLKKDRHDRYVAQLKREISGFKNFDVSQYTGSKSGALLVNALFTAWAKIYDDGNAVELTPAAIELRRELREGAIKIQIQALPKIRDAYGPMMRKLLWEQDMSAKTFGDSFRTVEFVGGAFAANRNIKAFNDSLWETFVILRFKQVRYKWYAEADEYTRYSVESPDDGDFVMWREGGRYALVE